MTELGEIDLSEREWQELQQRRIREERDHYREKYLEQQAELETLRSELSALRPLSEAGTQQLETLRDAWARYVRRDLSLEELEGAVAELVEQSAPIPAAVHAVRRMLARDGGT